MFQLSILPGTSFRQDAQSLGLRYQQRPPYYVLETPTLTIQQMVSLMEEAQEALDVDFDPMPPPLAELPADSGGIVCGCRIDLDAGPPVLPTPERRAQAFVLWLQSAEFAKRSRAAAELITRLLDDNPHTTLQVTLEPTGNPEQLTAQTLEPLRAACFRSLSYLDRFYSLQPAGRAAAKRLVVILPLAERSRLGPRWARAIGEYASLVWRCDRPAVELDLEDFEYVFEPPSLNHRLTANRVAVQIGVKAVTSHRTPRVGGVPRPLFRSRETERCLVLRLLR